MMNPCPMLVVLALGVLLVLLVPWLAWRIMSANAQRAEFLEKYRRFCDQLCQIRIALAFLLGLAIGAFLISCRQEILWILRDGPACVALLFVLLVLAFAAAIWLVLRMLECGVGTGGPPPLFGSREKLRSAGLRSYAAAYSPYALLVLLALLVLWFLVRSCGESLGSLFGAPCGRLLLLVVLVAILFWVVRALELHFCVRKDPDPECCRRIVRTWVGILTLLLLAALLVVRICGDDLRQRDFDLAMVGIWWEGKYVGEGGAHLRWAFRYGLPFPEDGFDLYRRPTGGAPWTLLNTEGRIHPARVWTGPVPGADPVWQGRGRDRLPPDVHALYEGPNTENFDLLLDMVARDPYDTLYYMEGRDDPFVSQADADAFAASFAEPLMQWQLEPMSLLLTTALHPEVARLLGLYFIDRSADPGALYDYRVVGYWPNRTRSYTVRQLGQATTDLLPPTTLTHADTLIGVTRNLPNGDVWPTEASVALRWAPPVANPEASLTALDGVRAVLYQPERQDVGPLGAPVPPTEEDFAPLEQPDDTGSFVPIDPIAVLPREVDDGPDRWPEYFAYDRWVDYRTYTYRIRGIDLFGRMSPPSNVLTVAIHDLLGPTSPANIEARIYQRSDPAVDALVPADRDVLFPPAEANELAFRVSWLWPHELGARYPDLKEFRLYYKFQGYEDFADPDNTELWGDVTEWEGTLAAVPASAAQPSLPSRFEDPDNPGSFLVPPSDYYEVTLTDPPASLVAAISADDDQPVVYGFVTVASADHDPFNNVGRAGPPVVVLTRDFVPPAAPKAPLLTAPPGEPDDAGYAHLTLQVPTADSRYSYQFFRVRDRTLLNLPASPLPPGCPPDPDPVVAGLQGRASANPAVYQLASQTPIRSREESPGTWIAEVRDRLDASISQRFLYAARAIDPAGNVGPPSCPSLEVLSRDGMPPRAPVVNRVRSDEGSVVLTWMANREADLDRYEVYRTRDQERLNSKRKMTLVLAAGPTGTALPQTPGAGDASVASVAGDQELSWMDAGLRGARDYFYRLVAVDLAGNASALSDPVRARVVDTTPPAPPQWAATTPIVWAPNADGVIVPHLSWQTPPNEPDAQVQVQQRQLDGSPAWLSVSGWLSEVTFIDNTAAEGTVYHYRLRAMDPLGNRSDWSSVQTTP